MISLLGNRVFLGILLGLAVSHALANEAIPPEVQKFIEERDVCDHFRGEPYEGDTPEQKQRRIFVIEQLEKYCTGTDKRLSDLKRNYRNNSEVMERLNRYEENVEGN